MRSSERAVSRHPGATGVVIETDHLREALAAGREAEAHADIDLLWIATSLVVAGAVLAAALMTLWS